MKFFISIILSSIAIISAVFFLSHLNAFLSYLQNGAFIAMGFFLGLTLLSGIGLVFLFKPKKPLLSLAGDALSSEPFMPEHRPQVIQSFVEGFTEGLGKSHRSSV